MKNGELYHYVACDQRLEQIYLLLSCSTNGDVNVLIFDSDRIRSDITIFRAGEYFVKEGKRIA